jgi:hypothetical protein
VPELSQQLVEHTLRGGGGLRRRNNNVFERDVTQQEQHIIDARVAAQRQMFDVYEKREKSRKVRVCVGPTPETTPQGFTGVRSHTCLLGLHSHPTAGRSGELFARHTRRKRHACVHGVTHVWLNKRAGCV